MQAFFDLRYNNIGGDNMIERTEYLEKLKKWKDKDLIKVVTGIRRCGKSTLFELFIEYLKTIGIEENHIISINLENPDNDFENYKDFYKFVKQQIKDEKQYYIFLILSLNIEILNHKQVIFMQHKSIFC